MLRKIATRITPEDNSVFVRKPGPSIYAQGQYPLAALVFTTHLLRSHPNLSDDMAELVNDSNEMLDRISATVRKVLIESQQ
jgi:hypothetical protein